MTASLDESIYRDAQPGDVLTMRDGRTRTLSKVSHEYGGWWSGPGRRRPYGVRVVADVVDEPRSGVVHRGPEFTA